MMNFKKKLAFFIILAGSGTQTFAQGILLNNSDLRNDLIWLNQQGVIHVSTSTWPLSGDEILKALEQANVQTPVQEKVITSIKNNLKVDNGQFKVGLFAETDQSYLPQSFGDVSKSQYQGNIELNGGGDNWDAKLHVNLEKDQIDDNNDDVNVEGSYIAGKLWNQWVVAGQIPTWWGPGHEGSLIRGDASRPVYGFTMQRAIQNAFETKWLSWIGPWQYQAFAGQLKDYHAVPDAKLLGLRLTAQPFPYLEVGASRVLQWGGEGRSESFSTLWDAIKGNDNVYDTNEDRSNQLAGLDFRLGLNGILKLPVSLYGQAVGEDEAGGLPSRKLYLAGVDFASSFKNMPYSVYAEWADTRTNGDVRGYTYNHSVYTDGFYQHGYPLAYPIGGDGEMYSVGGGIRFDSMNRLSGRVLYTKVNQSNLAINQAFPQEDKIKALDLTWTHYLKPDIPLKINGWISDSEIYHQDSGASISIEIPIEFMH